MPPGGHRLRHCRPAFLLWCVAGAFASSPAYADWRFCLAPSSGAKKLYISDLFQSRASTHDLQERSAGDYSGWAFHSIKLSGGNSKEALRLSHAHAIDYNQREEFEIVEVTWQP
jgi:hypothetical protein